MSLCSTIQALRKSRVWGGKEITCAPTSHWKSVSLGRMARSSGCSHFRLLPGGGRGSSLKMCLKLLQTGLSFSFPKTTVRVYIFTFCTKISSCSYWQLYLLLPSGHVCPFHRHLGFGADLWEAGNSPTGAFSRFCSHVQAIPSSESRAQKSHVSNSTFFSVSNILYFNASWWLPFFPLKIYDGQLQTSALSAP